MRQASKTRAKQLREYFKKRKEFLAGKYCKVDNCGAVAEEIHHMKAREGNRLLDETHWLATCRFHHTKIELNPEWAKQKGYSLNRNI